MAVASHQTIRLGAGRHAGPDDGACVMELASMLAGEPFSDQPGCCCPIVGAFLRTYNDLLDDERRQDLYRFAALVVDSRTDPDVEQVRAAMSLQWASSRHHEWHRRGLRRLWPFGWTLKPPGSAPAGAGMVAARVAARNLDDDPDRHHAEALGFVERLLATTRAQVAAEVRGRAADPGSVVG